MVDRRDATAGRQGWVLIENEGALFRGFGRSHPQEVWTPKHGWQPYAHADLHRPIEWGDVISEEETFERMAEWERSATTRDQQA